MQATGIRSGLLMEELGEIKLLYWYDQGEYGARETPERAGVSLDPGAFYMLCEQIVRRLSGRKPTKLSARPRLKTAALSRESYLEILEAVEEAYYEADLKGNITFSNNAAFSLLGYHKEEFIGSNYRLFYKNPRAVLAA
ncbi:MAG TPA: PAS domain S-box protein, partial [Firmicutes bacterium]|nr:PAS domain S-box protein [Bacillota bacterium]